jgi:hypothetical protein
VDEQTDLVTGDVVPGMITGDAPAPALNDVTPGPLLMAILDDPNSAPYIRVARWLAMLEESSNGLQSGCEADAFDEMTPKVQRSEDLCLGLFLRIAKWLALRPNEFAPEWRLEGKKEVSSSVEKGIQDQCFCEALVGFGFSAFGLFLDTLYDTSIHQVG